MTPKHKSSFKAYFSDVSAAAIALTCISFFAIAACLLLNGYNKFFWCIPVALSFLYISFFPCFVLYHKAKQDIKTNNIKSTIVTVSSIYLDDRFNLMGMGGRRGKFKYKLVDNTGRYYLLSAATPSRDLDFGSVLDFPLELELIFLSSSKLVLEMKIINTQELAERFRKHKFKFKHFQQTFSQYF